MSEIDLQQVLREIDEEVEARRAAGDFPPGMERDLDLIFARFAPAVISTDDLDALIEQADRGSFIDVDVPTGSRMPVAGAIKKVQRKLLSWYFRYLAQQVSVFATAVVGALRLLGRRVAALEAAVPGADPNVRDESRRAAPPTDLTPFVDAIVGHLGGVVGRVLIAECGDASAVRRLTEAGLDAYGCDHHLALVETAGSLGLDVRPDDAIDHLRAVDREALAGLVLAGVVDRVPVGSQLVLADLAAHALGERGRLVLAGTVPDAWGRSTSVVDADLSPGRPLHAETWVHLLSERGFRDVESHPIGATSYVVTATRQR